MKVAIYARVSTDEQTEQNQVPILEEWARQRGYVVYDTYRDIGSAWQKADQKELSRLIEDARKGRFSVVIVWALDRISRGGIGKMFTVLDTLKRYNVRVISHQETWTDVPSELQPLLFSIFAWIAEQESKRISARTKLGMERARTQGKHIGRPKKEL
jgi:DNA invertase Pin-like site-specific DNA recombinase